MKHNFDLKKVFNYHYLPENLKSFYKLGYGCTVLIKVDIKSYYTEVREISKWLIENGASNHEEVFIFKS